MVSRALSRPGTHTDDYLLAPLPVPMDVDAMNQSGVDESQMSDMNLITLEKNSFNFLEYAVHFLSHMLFIFVSRYTRMQYQTLPATQGIDL